MKGPYVPFGVMTALVIALGILCMWQQIQLRKAETTRVASMSTVRNALAVSDKWHQMYDEAIVLCAGIR